MSTVQEIETAISNLPPQDFARLRDWLLERDAQLWDKQIEEDGAAGKFQPLIEEIEKDIAAGRVKPLDGIIGDT
jgi:hypothetical protein